MPLTRTTLANFIKTYNGKYVDTKGNGYSTPDWENRTKLFRGQCASLVRVYNVRVLGLPDKSYGDGKMFDETMTKTSPKVINIGKDLKKAKDGDILVWDNMGVYGHVAIYYKGKMFSQNPNAAKLIPIWAGVTDILRMQSAPPKIKKWPKKDQYAAKVDVLKRLTPSANGKGNIYGVYEKSVKYVSGKNKGKYKVEPIWFWGEITANGIKWYVYTNIKGKTTYVASKYLKKA